jgi:hypothetical protein
LLDGGDNGGPMQRGIDRRDEIGFGRNGTLPKLLWGQACLKIHL